MVFCTSVLCKNIADLYIYKTFKNIKINMFPEKNSLIL